MFGHESGARAVGRVVAVSYLLSYQDRWHREAGCSAAEAARAVREQSDTVGAYGDLCTACFADGELDG